ncbi:hypothetical protein DRJ48_02045 [Candidatus Woesearchaeota archaeon]|nr:hypothetical protein [Candidatus Woesearchaeota archaeon]RLE43021.1 MAG: hypothetical protein DRJ48_02045 [Candidatus Woesearchaeota archaeon]
MESSWKKFDKANDAHKFIVDAIEKIEKAKTQRIVGKKPAQYVVECGVCGKPVQLAFTGVNIKKKHFVCFNCLAEE